MKFLADEHIPLMTVEALREAGHDMGDIRGTLDEGMSDGALWNLAQRERRILLTCDKGFARYRGEPHSGILIVRLRRPNRSEIHRRILRAIEHLAPEAGRTRLSLCAMWRKAFGAGTRHE